MKINRTILTTAAIAIAAAAAPAVATPVIVDVSGTAGTVGAYTGVLNLDVTNGMVTNATGTLSIAGLTDAPLGLVTTGTPGNEDDGSGYPVGLRANDGTDIYETDQLYPFDQGGLLFAVGSATPVAGESPLINFYSNGGTPTVLFTGNVGGTEYYAQVGTLEATEVSTAAVPEAATWAMMMVGLGVVGGSLRRRSDAKFDAKVKRIAAGLA